MEKVTGADFKSATADDNKKLFIETYGCQMNVADSEVIASVMQMAGYSVADTLEEADAVFMNTCSIRDNAEQKILNRLEFFHSLKKKKRGLIVGVLGCMAERVKDDLITNHHVDLVVGPDAYLTLPELIASVEAGEKAMNVELSTTETYRDVIPRAFAETTSPASSPSCVGAIISVLTASFPTPVAVSVAVMWKASSMKWPTSWQRVIRKSPCWDRTSILIASRSRTERRLLFQCCCAPWQRQRRAYVSVSLPRTLKT